MTTLVRFLVDCLREVTRGGRDYWVWMASLMAVASLGLVAYIHQLRQGLIVSGMSDQVSWGAYIANFTFLVGVAAAAVMVVVPAYIFHHAEAKSVVLVAEGVAAAACMMCILFVMVDLGRPDRFWHMIPFVGRFNWPVSMLAWDVIVLNVYLMLNIFIPFYVLFNKYQGVEPPTRKYFPWVLLSIFWAISIHTVTAFLYSWNPARPFWHTALLGPRFIASAFAAGPAFILLTLKIIDMKTDFKVSADVGRLLALIAAVALQINMFMLGAEVFTEFYSPTQHTASARYLFLGLDGHNALQPWIYTALSMQAVALVILMVHPLRQNRRLLYLACGLTIVGIWTEKGMGLIIPGFIPTPLGEILEYTPSWTELMVSLGIWALGFAMITVLAKAAIAVDLGRLRFEADISLAGPEVPEGPTVSEEGGF